MFEVAELGQKLDADAFKELEPQLRAALLDVQFSLKEAGLALAIIIAGVEGAGKGEALHHLLSWFDPRGVETHAASRPADVELERPPYYRFWVRLPARGDIGIFFGSWYTLPIVERVLDVTDEARFRVELDRIREFERMLSAENVLVVKLWLHITKKQQKKRFKKLEKDPDTAWRVTRQDWEYHKRYDDFVDVCSRALRKTSTGYAPWHIVEADNARYRHATIAQHIVDAARARLDAPSAPKPEQDLPVPAERNVLNTLDLTKALSKKEYRAQLEAKQAKLARLARRMVGDNTSLMIVFEGMDAGGKGGAIRRVTPALDARFYRVVRIAAPTPEEAAHPYLWRFWRHVPRDGHTTIFDRSWYGRVLVERIEGFCAPEAWRRAYREINEFEEQLHESKVLVIKFWIAISAEEQLARFKEREVTSYKQYKITDEDWRNREKWPAYEAAAAEMIAQTSTVHAPWTLVEGNNKRYARIKVLSTIVDRLEKALGPAPKPKKHKN